MKDRVEPDGAETEGSVADLSYCNNAALRKATRRLGQLYDDVLAPSGLKATQCTLLIQIRALGQGTLRELASSLVMDQSALGHTLKPLIRDGLVALAPDPHDRRVKRVVLTDAGVRKFEEALTLWRAAQDRFESAYGRKKAEQLRSVLNFVASEAFADAF